MRLFSRLHAERSEPHDRARPEPVEALADPRRRGVRRGRDPHVVPAVVLDVEVAVEALREGDLRQPALVGLLLVTELVGGVDADAADAADRDGDADPVDDRGHVRSGDHVHRTDESGVLDRQEQIGDPAVVPVALERLDDVVWRVGPVEAGDQVDGRDDAQDHDRADPEPRAPAGQPPHRDGDEGQGGDHEPDQPQVALACRATRSVPDDRVRPPRRSGCTSPIMVCKPDVQGSAHIERLLRAAGTGEIGRMSATGFGSPVRHRLRRQRDQGRPGRSREGRVRAGAGPDRHPPPGDTGRRRGGLRRAAREVRRLRRAGRRHRAGRGRQGRRAARRPTSTSTGSARTPTGSSPRRPAATSTSSTTPTPPASPR